MAVGQGRPALSVRRALHALAAWMIVTGCAVIHWTCSPLFAQLPIAPMDEASVAVDPESVDCELRIVWGGGAARNFAGTIAIDDGTIAVAGNLSLQDDAVGTARSIDATSVELLGHSAASFGGVDIHLRGRTDSQISFKWKETDSSAAHMKLRDLSVSLSQLLDGAWVETIDGAGNRIAVERQIRDRIRVQCESDMVLSPGEKLQLRVSGNRTGLGMGDYRLSIRTIDAATSKIVQQQTKDVSLNELGSFDSLNINLPVPNIAGVFQLEFSLHKRRFINSLVGMNGSPSRKLEFVVVAPAIAPQTAGHWQSVQTISPFESNWWEPIQRLSTTTPMQSLSSLASFSGRAISSHPHQHRTLDGQQILVLSPTAWQAYPLRVASPGTAHRLVLNVPQDQSLRMIVSIQEPNAAGEVGPVSFDSGIIIDDPPSSTEKKIVVHEYLFWPKTNRPYVLIMNADPYRNASLHSIEVQQRVGPLIEPQQPARANQISNGDQGPSEPMSSQRLMAMVIDKPLLVENFGARRVIDPASGRALDGWQTWVEATERLSQFTKWAGYNCVSLTIATRGGAIFPSRTLQPSAKFDSGIFLSDGRSPQIKDIVELVCRQCDDMGLRVILSLELEGSLPGLFKVERGGAETTSAFQMDVHGRNLLLSTSANGERLVHYNPLYSLVQTELEGIVREVLQRYGHHHCFAGISLSLGPRSHFNFAGDRWGYDKDALSKFGQHLQARLPTEPQQLEELFRGPARQDFLHWRARELAVLYARIAQSIVRASPNARLYLNPTKLLEAPPSEESYYEYEAARLNPSRILLAAGLDCEELGRNEHICLLRPEIDAPLQSPVGRSWGLQLAGDNSLDQLLHGPQSGLAIYQVPKGIRMTSFDEKSPFGADKTRVWLFPHLASTDQAARQRIVRRLMQSDRLMIGEGSWMGILGQAEALRGLHGALAKLPPLALRDLSLASSLTNSTIRVRKATYDGRSYLQLVNGASWQETIELQVRNTGVTADSACFNAIEHNVGRLQNLETRKWQILLRPYDVATVEIRGANIDVVGIEHRPVDQARQMLAERLNDLETLINDVGDPTRQEPLKLMGGDFEAWLPDGLPVGWTVSTLPDVNVVCEPELPKSGKNCLRIEKTSNSGVTAWIQSEKIPVVPTGRLAVEAWVRSAPGQDAPPVRLSLIGRYRDGRKYHRWHKFGGQSSEPSIPLDWGGRPTVLLVPDVPSEELSELQVAFDLLKAGTVWIDDVKIYGMYLHPDERIHLRGQVFLAKEKLRENNLYLGNQLLDSYWARYLSTYANDFPSVAPTQTLDANTTVVKSIGEPDRKSVDPSAKSPWRSASPNFLQQWRENMRQRWQR